MIKKSIKQDDTLKQDKIKKVREPKTKKVEEVTKCMSDKLLEIYDILMSVEKNASLLMCDMLKETMQKR